MSQDTSSGAMPDDGWPGQLLHQAALFDNVGLLRSLLEGDELSNINVCDRMGRSVVYTAVSNNSLKCLKLLLSNGANPNIAAGERYNRMSPLHSAICDNKEDAVRILLINNADLELVDMSGLTPVEVARSVNNRILISLIEAEVERRKIRMYKIFKTFSELCANGETEKVRDLLSNNWTDLRRILGCVPKGGFPALSSAVKSGSFDLVELLLELGAKPIPHTENGLTPLHLACETGTVEVVSILMKKFTDLCIMRTVDHQLPFHRAAACGRTDILQYLLAFPYSDNFLHSYVDKRSGRYYYSSIDVNPIDSTGMTPLHLATETGSLEAVKLLLDHTAKLEDDEEPLESTDQTGYARMTSTTSEGHSLDKEVDPYRIHPVDRDIKSNEGLTALHYAIKNHHPDIAQVLVKGGTDLSTMVMVDESPLSYLAYTLARGDPEVFELLLRHGAEDTDNISMKRAQETNNKEIIQLLLQHKTSKDHIHTINKTEMKLAYAEAHSSFKSYPDRTSLPDEYRRLFPSCPVSVNWHRQQLDSIDKQCLIRASFVHNLAMRPIDNNLTALYAITKIDISHNYFTELPKIMFELPSLQVLNAAENRIKRFPLEKDLERAVECLQIEELHLQVNSLEMLPNYLFRLPALKYFNVSRNCLKRVPIDMWTAPSLNHFNLAQNDLTQLPHWEIGEPNLSRRSTIASIASSSNSDHGDFENDSGCGFLNEGPYQEPHENTVNHYNWWRQRLIVSDLDRHKMNDNQTGIRHLNIAGNKFIEVPPCLACCAPYLEVLNMTDNRLDTVGPLGHLPQSLIELNLCRTGLESLFPWIQNALQDQHCFGLSKSASSPTQFRMSPRSHSPSISSVSSFSPLQAAATINCPHCCHVQLPLLEKLNLSHNKLRGVVLTKMARTISATSMDVTAANFSMESDEIQSRLLFPNMSELDVSYNNLTCLPPDIGELTNLKVLSLSRNPLKELPPKLGLLKKLWKLELELCPLDGVIQDMIKSSRYPTKDILGFLLSVLEESTEYNCMNLMIVGSHEIGKTSLLQRLNKEGKMPSIATHWKDRVSNTQEVTRPRGQTLSTVGIDISQLVIDRRSKGAVHFRTWDFGGQREYYATHQYFLSPRSLYLVLWNLTHGPKGVESLLQWLVNIQARAPGAPVIIIGTHLDKLEDRATRRSYPEDFEEAMMGLVHKNFILVKEPEKCGLPNILDAINVSCKSGKHVSKLVDMIYDHAFDLKHPRSRTQKLLKQKIPKKYLLLQNVVMELAQERLHDNKEPVLSKSKYMLCVSNKMMETGTTFRDVEELEQATRFLHENGVLFHYEDLSLKDLYFLDPQWLCDQLAKVVTIKEINRFASRGIMKIKNLELLFKNSLQPMDIQRDITSLLNKFEVALQFDDENLLLPSLLPTEEDLQVSVEKKCDVRIPLRRPEDENTQVKRRSRPLTTDVVYVRPDSVKTLTVGKSTFYSGPQQFDESSSRPDSRDLLLLGVKATSNPIFSFCRLYFMTYFPSGFWPRLITRVLADSSLYHFAMSLFKLPEELMQRSPGMKTLFDTEPEWRCWQTGLILNHLGFEMLRIREVLSDSTMGFCDYMQCRLKCNVESEWAFLDVMNSKILEISLPTDSLTFHLTNKAGPQIQTLDPTNRTTLFRDDSAAAKLLGKLIEHIDNLLQDWYPEIGEVRFTQNCEGRYLITRIVLCPQCLYSEVQRQRKMHSDLDSDAWFWMNPEVPNQCSSIFISQGEPSVAEEDAEKEDEDEEESSSHGGGQAEDRSRLQTGQAIIFDRAQRLQETEAIIYSHLVERCMLDMMEGVNICCPVHASVSPAHLLGDQGQSYTFFVAPDLAFRDVDRELLITETDRLDIGRELGKGTFGKVFAGNLFRKGEEPVIPVAVKVLFSGTREEAKQKRQSIESRMDRACQAYLTARQEISILESISHPNIVPMLGLATRPLSLILSLAPHGSLDSSLKMLDETGRRLPLFVIRQIIVQVAQALAYLHDRNIIYRDLKSENILVWSLPLSPEASTAAPVDVKLADYGISRSVMPTGAKGFGGTPPFIAPEILQHAGKDTYTEKVDIFSFGMCMYELITCRQPFCDVNNPSTLVCQGSRPTITTQEVNLYPTCILDLMSVSWSQDPEERPSAASIVTIARSPLFCHLRDVVSLGQETKILCGCSVPAREAHDFTLSASSPGSPGIDPELLSDCSQSEPETRAQIWLSVCLGPRYYIDILSYDRWSHCVDSKTIQLPGAEVTAMSVINSYVWCVDAIGKVMVFSSESQQLVHSFKLPVMMVPQVHGLYYVPTEPAIIVTLKNGNIFVRSQPQPGPLSDSHMDLYQTAKSYSSCCIKMRDRYEIWLGQDGGKVGVWDVHEHRVFETLSHPEPMATNKCCKFLVAAKIPGSEDTLVWSYVYPGVLVYRWDVKTRAVVETLDCSRVAPSTESPNRSSGPNSSNKYQVTAMNVLGSYLYLGTTWGNVIVADSATLKPLSMFKCHCAKEFYIRSIFPLLSEEGAVQSDDSFCSPGIVTLGRGYIDIIKESKTPSPKSRAESDPPDLESRPRTTTLTQDLMSRDPTVHHNFVLSWWARGWELF
ncbi:leucine-rich repeat serine/threonine-protein kinase 1-like [Haliotis cracherodii]|uniref:leucine-rich repeat serine/threonine-protein kinase 1-like n=1 Tax=Haliotis cracherodii TaxID=6455 RepID=UPI0039E83F90